MSDEQPSPEVTAQAQAMAKSMTKAAVGSEFFDLVKGVNDRVAQHEMTLRGLAGTLSEMEQGLSELHDHIARIDRNLASLCRKHGADFELPCGGEDTDG